MLIRRLNKIRHQQAKKVDILCNDMVSAHADFIRQLRSLNFSIDFYESILGHQDMTTLLDIVVEHIRNHVNNANVLVFLINRDGYEIHIGHDDEPIEIDIQKIESYFTDELVGSISRSNRACSLDEMFEVGLQANLQELSKVSAAAIPLGGFGSPVGFILVCRPAACKITSREIENITSITPGLTRAIRLCQAFARTENARKVL